MDARSRTPRRGHLFFTALALAVSAACTTQQAAQGTTAPGVRPGDACSTGPLLDCPEGQVDGCALGTTTEHRCVAAGPGRCLDIRAALVVCKGGEILTHEGCPGPEYIKRCAPGSAPRPPQQS